MAHKDCSRTVTIEGLLNHFMDCKVCFGPTGKPGANVLGPPPRFAGTAGECLDNLEHLHFPICYSWVSFLRLNRKTAGTNKSWGGGGEKKSNGIKACVCVFVFLGGFPPKNHTIVGQLVKMIHCSHTRSVPSRTPSLWTPA